MKKIVTVDGEVLTVDGEAVETDDDGTTTEYNIGAGLQLDAGTNTLSVNAASAVEEGNTNPVMSAAVWGLIGNLSDLTTTAKENLVAAINEAAKTGSGGAGSIDLRTADGYIQYSNDGGETWENLIALAELKGEKGEQGEKGDTGAPGPQGVPGEQGPQGETGPAGPQGKTGPAGTDGAPGKDGSPGKDGADGAPGQDGYSPSASVAETATGATITITDKTGTTTAEIKNGKDGAPGKDGTDGAPGTPGTNGTDGKDGTTFTPSVSAAGDLSWTNDGGKANPAPVNLKGPQGETGPQGPTGATGPQGAPGADYTLTDADKTEIAAEAAAAIAGTSLPAPASAAVGQIVKIKAVDAAGKITETEAVDMPTGGGEDAWEKIADVAFAADTPVYEVANFGVYRKVKVLMSRAAYVSGLNKNVWFRIRNNSTSEIASVCLVAQYGYLTWEVNAEVDTFVYMSRQMTNNPVVPGATEKTVAILPPAEPGSLKFNIEFTDTSVIQAGDTVAVYGVKR